MNTVRVLSDNCNYVVVHVEGRRYPGLVVQGDRLHAWLRYAQSGDAMTVDLLAGELAQSLVEYQRVVGTSGDGTATGAATAGG